MRNAASEADAVEVGRSVARNNLFKAAIFGNDPNWGRVLAAIGTTDGRVRPVRRRRLDERRARVHRRAAPTRRARTSTSPRARRDLVIDLKVGDATATILTNDLTHDYVHENSAYSS